MRQRIVRLYIESGEPIPVKDLAAKLGLSEREFQQQLNGTAKLAELGALRIEQAEELIRFYGGDFLFETDVVQKVVQFRALRQKLDQKEKQARSDGDPPTNR